jgi:hypothetical protein
VGFDDGHEWGVDLWTQVAGQYLANVRHLFPDQRFLSAPFSVANISATNPPYTDPFDGVAMHYYWPASQGAPLGYGHSFSKPVVFTEFNSNPTQPDQIAQAIEHFASDAAFCLFMADAPDNFANYNVTAEQAAAIRTAMEQPPAPPPVPPPEPAPAPPSSPAWDANAPVEARMNDLKQLICDAADAHAVPRDIAAGLVEQESGGYIGAYNRQDGGSGLTQITPPYHPDVDYHRCLSDPAYALDQGLRILRGDYAASWRDALTAYNGDPTGHVYADSVLALSLKYTLWNPVAGGSTTTLRAIRDRALTYVGHTYTDEGNAEFGMCEQFVEEVLADEGVPRTRFSTAAVHGDALVASGSLRAGEWHAGAVLVFGRTFDPAGHICIGDTFPYVITTYPNSIQRLDATAIGWYPNAGYLGYYIPDGVTEEDDMALPVDGKADDGIHANAWQRTGIPLNEQSGFYQRWLALVKAGVPIGVPYTEEYPASDGRTIQHYSSGATMTFVDGVVYVN